MRAVDRRAVMLGGLGLGSVALSGCSAMRDMPMVGALFEDWPVERRGPVVTPDYARIYAPVSGERHPVRAFDFADVDPGLLRAEVAYAGQEPAGTVVVDTRRFRLYLVGEAGRATRYGIAVGPEARGFAGRGVVVARWVWPDWTPIVRRDAFAQFESRPVPRAAEPARVPGGPRSPRGARALYLAANGRDVRFVIHGTPEPDTVGSPAGQGCVALVNQDVIDLFRRTREGTRAVVLG